MGIADTLAEQGYRVLLSDPFYGDTAAGKEDIMDTWIHWNHGKWMKVPGNLYKCTLTGKLT